MLQAGEEIDIWVVDRALGAGGMGSVYRCHNRAAPRILAAVKVLEVQARRMPEAEERFIREAEILFALDHPHIVKVRNVRTDLDMAYIEMEFVDGESLEDVLQRGPLPYDTALEYFDQLADALAYLHARGISHRDIKPANILIGPHGQLKLVDFGLAMEADASRITQQGMNFGTVSYAPPEWINPSQIIPEQWDIYALGVVYWEMLTGAVAFPVSGHGSARQQAMQVIISKQSHAPLDPGEGFPDGLRDLIGDMTHNSPTGRPDTAGHIAKRLGEIDPTRVRSAGPTLLPSADLSVPTATPRPPRPATTLDAPDPSSRLAWSVAGAAALLALAAFAGVAVLALLSPGSDTRAVELRLEHLSDDAPVEVLFGDTLPSRRDGHRFSWDRLPIGEQSLTIAYGLGCRVLDCVTDDCPRWCLTSTVELTIGRGKGPLPIAHGFQPPSPRQLEVHLPSFEGEPVLRVHVDGVKGKLKGKVWSATVGPGEYTIEASAGICASKNLGCSQNGTCPAGCSSIVQVAQLSPIAEPHVLQLDLPAPQHEAEAPGQALSPAEPEPGQAAQTQGSIQPTRTGPGLPRRSATASAQVTRAQFARWIAKHPAWSPGGDKAVRLADAHYLEGWSGAAPPPGTETHAVVRVSYHAAMAYCARRGGLTDKDASPRKWSESGGRAALEWRSEATERWWRDSGGGTGHQPSPKHTTPSTGFRCAK